MTSSGEEDVGAIAEGQRLAHVVIREQNADARRAQIDEDLVQRLDRQRIDSRERLIEEKKARIRGQASRDLEAALLSAGQHGSARFRQVGEPKTLQQLIGAAATPSFGARSASSGASPGCCRVRSAW